MTEFEGLIQSGTRTAWQETKRLKTRMREERYEKKLALMESKYKWLLMMEHKALTDGRIDFSVDELYEMLYYAYFDARPGKRKTYDVQRVEANLFDNIYRLARDIHDRCYYPSRSEAFIVFDPVIREIFAASFRDRIVHHLLINICMPWWQRHFVRDSYSCRLGKGTNYGVRRAVHHIAKVSDNYQKTAYFVKMDIKGFFMSMDRRKLMELAVSGAHSQFREFGPLGRLAAFLWRQIIMDDPLEEVRIRGKVKDWNHLPRDKSLFFQSKGYGIVIGNLTSQLLSNVFLDQLDKYIVYTLGYHHYGRYVDDFYVVINEEQLPQMEKDIERIRAYLAGLGLTMHPNKTRWLRVDKGVTYLGHHIKNGHIEMDHRYQSKYYQALVNVMEGVGQLDVVTSYMGGCINYGCRKMQQRIWRAAGQNYTV
jgi:hypothetical protein